MARVSPGINTEGGVAFCTITLAGLAINCVAVFVTLKVAKKQALPPNIFLGSLGCMDLFGLVIVTLPTLLAYLNEAWVGGETLCKAQGLASLFCVAASGLAAVLVSADRALAVMKPFWYYRCRRRRRWVAGCCAAVFALSVSLSLLPLIKINAIITWRYPGTYCTFTNFSRVPEVQFFALVFCTFCLACSAVVVALNLVVGVKMRRRRRLAERLPCSHIYGKQRLDNERQHVRTMAAVSLLHMTCWVPFLVHALVVASHLSAAPEKELVQAWLLRIFVLKFVLDPLAYLLTRPQYRRTVAGLFFCRKPGVARIGPSWEGPRHCGAPQRHHIHATKMIGELP